MPHQPPPPGWPQLVPSLHYRLPAQAIAWLRDAFGFEVRMQVDGARPGEVVHSELTYGGAMIMVGGTPTAGEPPEPGREFASRHASPLDLEGRLNASLCLFVDDPDAHCAHARAHGAAIHTEPRTVDYGPDYWSDRSYGAYDLEGHAWWFMKRVRG